MKLKKYAVRIRLFVLVYFLYIITLAACLLGGWFIEARRSDASSFIENPTSFFVAFFVFPLILLTLIACLDFIRNRKK